LTESYLCNVCSCQEILRRHGRGQAPSSSRTPKTIRLLRLGKLLRLARLKRMLQKYQDAFDFAPYLRLVITFFAILFAAHMMACVWYEPILVSVAHL
jgi:hypothetical protein